LAVWGGRLVEAIFRLNAGTSRPCSFAVGLRGMIAEAQARICGRRRHARGAFQALLDRAIASRTASSSRTLRPSPSCRLPPAPRCAVRWWRCSHIAVKGRIELAAVRPAAASWPAAGLRYGWLCHGVIASDLASRLTASCSRLCALSRPGRATPPTCFKISFPSLRSPAPCPEREGPPPAGRREPCASGLPRAAQGAGRLLAGCARIALRLGRGLAEIAQGRHVLGGGGARAYIDPELLLRVARRTRVLVRLHERA